MRRLQTLVALFLRPDFEINFCLLLFFNCLPLIVFFISFCNLLFHLFALEICIVCEHSLLDFVCLLFCFVNFLASASFLFLQHAHAVLQLEHVLLKFESDWARLSISQIFGFQVDNDIRLWGLLLLASATFHFNLIRKNADSLRFNHPVNHHGQARPQAQLLQPRPHDYHTQVHSIPPWLDCPRQRQRTAAQILRTRSHRGFIQSTANTQRVRRSAMAFEIKGKCKRTHKGPPRVCKTEIKRTTVEKAILHRWTEPPKLVEGWKASQAAERLSRQGDGWPDPLQ